MRKAITGVMLNWKRCANVTRIVESWRDTDLLSDAIVWNNNADELFKHDWARVINAQQNFGVYPRFAAACLAENHCVLIQDDDLELPFETLRALYEFWQQDSAILHGIFGRAARPDGSYAQDLHGEGEAPIVLTRALLTHRRYAAAFFQVAPKFDEIQRDARPPGNGEDIIFSYTVMRQSGRLNRIHRVPVIELPAPDAIHGLDWKSHVAHRTRLLRACEAWLKGQRA